MQEYEKSNTEAKTFPEIWSGLDRIRKNKLSRELFKAKCCLSRQSIWEWGSGAVQPRQEIVRDAVAKTVSKFLGIKTTPEALFPAQ